MVALWENVGTATVTVLALFLTLVALRAWWHTRNVKVLYLTLGFALFLVKGAFFSYGLFRDPSWEESLFVPALFLDAAILVLFYLAVLKRSTR